MSTPCCNVKQRQRVVPQFLVVAAVVLAACGSGDSGSLADDRSGASRVEDVAASPTFEQLIDGQASTRAYRSYESVDAMLSEEDFVVVDGRFANLTRGFDQVIDPHGPLEPSAIPYAIVEIRVREFLSGHESGQKPTSVYAALEMADAGTLEELRATFPAGERVVAALTREDYRDYSSAYFENLDRGHPEGTEVLALNSRLLYLSAQASGYEPYTLVEGRENSRVGTLDEVAAVFRQA